MKTDFVDAIKQESNRDSNFNWPLRKIPHADRLLQHFLTGFRKF